MEFSITSQKRQAMVDAARHMTPLERLKAFLAHSRLMAKLHAAGARFRSDSKGKQSSR